MDAAVGLHRAHASGKICQIDARDLQLPFATGPDWFEQFAFQPVRSLGQIPWCPTFIGAAPLQFDDGTGHNHAAELKPCDVVACWSREIVPDRMVRQAPSWNPRRREAVTQSRSRRLPHL
jgi:hypothetical protein